MTPQSKPNTDDIRIKEIKELVPPAHVFREYPVSSRAASTTFNARQTIHRILHGADDRLLVVIGPCSIHDTQAALEYAAKLQPLRDALAGELLVVMRVYFEKPRTTVGWKGLINDPDLEAGTGQLVFAGGVQITSGFSRLHGLSDIKFEDAERFFAVTDEGLLVRGRVELDAAGRLAGVAGLQVRPLVDPDGAPLIPKYLADAEGLALMPNGELLVSFERLHRVWRYDRDGRWLGERVIPDFPFTENEGMEGIAWAAGDAFWAAGENGGLWWCEPEACAIHDDPPEATPTDADLRLTSLTQAIDGERWRYELSRSYNSTTNTNVIAIQRRESARCVYPCILGRWIPTIFTAPATVDNFEGIAAVDRKIVV